MTEEWKIKWSGRAHDYTDEEIEFITNVIKEGDPLTQGKYLRLFEQKLAGYLGVDEGKVFALNSATSALEVTACLLHIEDGDEIIVPAHTFCASAIPFLRRKAKLVWADIDPETWVISLDDVRKKVTPRTKAIILVHLYGGVADVDAFLSFASERNITVIEDMAQAFGARYKGKRAGTLGDFGVFSFHAQKNMTTLGEGGAIYARDEKSAQKIQGLRSFGFTPFKDKEFYWKPAMTNVDSIVEWELPYKFTIPEVNCAAGIKLLDRIDDLNEQRKKRYWHFRESLASFPELVFQKIQEGAEASYHLLPAKYEGAKHNIRANRDDVLKLLSSKYGIQAIVQYYPLYRYDLFKKWGCGEAQCPATDDFFDNMLSFPFHVWMSGDDFQYMIDFTVNALRALRDERKP